MVIVLLSPFSEALLDGQLHPLLHAVDVVVVHHQVPDQLGRDHLDSYLPAQVLNLHPFLCDDGRHVGVHGDGRPRLPPLERLATPRRVLPLHRVDPLHLQMLLCLVQWLL